MIWTFRLKDLDQWFSLKKKRIKRKKKKKSKPRPLFFLLGAKIEKRQAETNTGKSHDAQSYLNLLPGSGHLALPNVNDVPWRAAGPTLALASGSAPSSSGKLLLQHILDISQRVFAFPRAKRCVLKIAPILRNYLSVVIS